jgi:hypothetical protein
LTVNVKSGLESAVVLLDPADVLNLEALDPDQIARDPLGGRSLDTEIAFSSPRLTWWIRARTSSLKRVSDCPARVRWWLT